MERRRNMIVRAEQTEALDEIFKSKADSFTYKNGSYQLHFTNPVTVKAIKEWSGCTDIEPVTKRKLPSTHNGTMDHSTPIEQEPTVKKRKEEKPTTTSIYHSVLKAQTEYDEMVAQGKMIDTVLKKYGFSEEVLQPKHTKPLKLYRNKEKHRQELKALKKEAVELCGKENIAPDVFQDLFNDNANMDYPGKYAFN